MPKAWQLNLVMKEEGKWKMKDKFFKILRISGVLERITSAVASLHEGKA